VREGAFAGKRRQDRVSIGAQHGENHQHTQSGGTCEEKSGGDLNHFLVLSASLCETFARSYGFADLFVPCSLFVLNANAIKRYVLSMN
jgi:hypothetical protein